MNKEIDEKVLETTQTANVDWLHREFANHQINGITPAKLSQILQGVEYGDMRAQCELAEDIEERDGHIAAELSKRKRAALTFKWDIVAPKDSKKAVKKAASAIKEQIENMPDFEDNLLDMMDALLKGYSCQAIEWKYDGIWSPKLHFTPQSWFMVAPNNRNELLLRSQNPDASLEVAAEKLWDFGWVKHIHKSKSGYLPRSGLIRVLAWPFLFKNYAVRDLAELLEIYGVPVGIGKYPLNASEEQKKTLLDALISIGHNARGIMPETMSLEFLKEAKGNADVFEVMIGFCERTCSKAILGGTLTSDSTSGTNTNALGNVHERAYWELVYSDLRQLASTLTRDLVRPLQLLNTTIDPSIHLKFEFDTTEKTVADIKTFSDLGWVFPRAWLAEKFQLPLAEETDSTLQNPFPNASPTPVTPSIIEPLPNDVQLTPAAAKASLTAQNDVLDSIEQFANDLSDDWKPVTSPVINPIQKALNEASSYEELRRLINEMDLSNDALVESLTNSLFMTHLYGRVNDV